MSECLMAEGPVWNGQHSQHNMINMRAFVSRIIVCVCRLVKYPRRAHDMHQNS